MKLRNKRTGGLANCEPITVSTDAGWHDYYSLAELNEEWEDFGGKDVRRQNPLAELSPYDYSKRNIVTDHTEPRGGSKE